MARRKRRVARAIEANQGARRAYQRAMVRLHRQFSDYVMAEMWAALQRGPAMDASPFDNPLLRALAKELRRKAGIAQGSAAEALRIITSRNLLAWIARLRQVAAPLVTRHLMRMVRSTTAAQMAALLAAGMRKSVIEERWTAPTVGRQHISPEAAAIIPDLVEGNVRLITKIGQADIERISGAMAEGVEKGLDYGQIRQALRDTQGFDDARAERVCMDQVNKIHERVNLANARAVGVTEGIWVHVPGQYSSRATHIMMNGRTFDLSEGMMDEAVGHRVFPGSEPFCRCVFRMVIPRELLDE